MLRQLSKRKPFNFGTTVVILSILAILAKTAGFAEKVVIARYFGTGASADIYFAATGLLLSFVFMVKELVHPTLLPVFSKTLKDHPANSAALFRKFLFICILVISVLGIGVFVFSDLLSQVFMPGFSPEKKEQASIILKYLSPALIFLSLSMVTYTVLNAHRKFLKAAMPETAYKILVLIGLFLLIPFLGLKAIPLVLSLSSIILCISMLIWIPENKFLFKRSFDESKGLSRVFQLMGPIALGVLFSHISGLVDNILASTLPDGHLSYLGYSKKLIDALLLIGPVALVTVSYSHLSNLSHGPIAPYLDLFVKVLRILVYVGIPGTILVVFLREPIVHAIFEGGEFGFDSAVGTSRGVLIYGLGFLIFALESHFVYSFYAISDTKTPVSVGIICVILDIILAISLIRIMGYLGIALAFVISKTIKVVILGYFLERRFSFVGSRGLFLFFIKTVLAAIPSTLLLLFLCRFDSNGNLIGRVVINLLLPAVGFSVSFAAFSVLFRIEEARQLMGFLLSRLRLRKAA